MALDPDLLALMPHTVTIAARSSLNGDGSPAFGEGVDWAARVQGQSRNVRNAQGEEVVSTSRVYVGGLSGITATGRITLPDGTSPPILAVSTVADESGDLYEVVDLQ